MAQVESRLGARHTLFIDGADHTTTRYADRRSPIDRDLRLGNFALADPPDVEAAMTAARAAFPAWRATPVAERVRLVRRIGDIMAERVYEIGAALTLEVGKNRMEALGEAQETVDLFHHYAKDFESHDGFVHALPDDPIEGVTSHNASVMRPYGPWIVIAPFNYPLALAGGPVAAALVTGNTVVVKGSSDTPWGGRLLADCVRDAGLPAGVFNYLTDGGHEIGEALVAHPLAAGVTFTGSVRTGRQIIQHMAAGAWPRPCIAEMGGKNPCIVTARANLDDAAAGIAWSAYGMGAQKCSTLSRLYVDERVADALIERLQAQIAVIRIGDPRRREYWLGPLINQTAYDNYGRYMAELRGGGAKLLSGNPSSDTGGTNEVQLALGYYVHPVLMEAPLQHPLWQREMFVPILLLHRCREREDAMRLANDSQVGLTAGFYGSADEVPWFQENIEAGVTYANRSQGATTGAWPGYQPFGGWKGSGSTGKAMASFHYLAQYMREQSRTVVE
ncbi:MAG: aldehyde dehydrogenase family protein [Rhodanobacteraceae bacterium]